MSISFSDEANDEIITTAASLPEDRNEGSLRPKTIREYIGQQKAKDNLYVFINAAKMRGDSLGPVLLQARRDSARRRLPPSSQTRWASTCASRPAPRLRSRAISSLC